MLSRTQLLVIIEVCCYGVSAINVLRSPSLGSEIHSKGVSSFRRPDALRLIQTEVPIEASSLLQRSSSAKIASVATDANVTKNTKSLPKITTLAQTDHGSASEVSQGHLKQLVTAVLGDEHTQLAISKVPQGDVDSQRQYVIVMCCAACALIFAFKERGAASCLAILCNVLALSVMSLLVRNIYVTASFKFPQFVTLTHALTTTVVGIAVLLGRWGSGGQAPTIPDLRTFFIGVVPIGVAFALSLSLANMGLLYTNAHYYEMIGSSGFLITAGVGILMGKPFDIGLLAPMVCITMGAMILAFGELHFSLVGTILILSAALCRALKAQLQGTLMSKEKSAFNLAVLDPLELVVCTSLVISLIMLGWSLAGEGTAPWTRLGEARVIVALLPAALNAAILNIAGLFVIRSVGPVAQQCIGQLKGVLCCVGSVAAFHEVISRQQIIGYAVVVCGVFWYNSADLKAAPAKGKALSDETKNVEKPGGN